MTRARKTKTESQMQRMTVTSGLKEPKLLNKRITSRIENLKAIRTRRSSTEVVAGVNKKDFEAAAREGMQALQALLARRDAIKAEIVRSNAQSTVEIGGKRMTVAAASSVNAPWKPSARVVAGMRTSCPPRKPWWRIYAPSTPRPLRRKPT